MLEALVDRLRTALRSLYLLAFPGVLSTPQLSFTIDMPAGRRAFRPVRGRFVIRGWVVTFEDRQAPAVRVRVGRAVYGARRMSRPDVRDAFGLDLPESCGFDLALHLGRGLHLVQIQVQTGAGGWRPLSTGWVLSLGLKPKPSPRVDYGSWTRLEAAWLDAERPELARHAAELEDGPQFLVTIGGDGDRAPTLASLDRQIYRRFSIAPETPAAPAMAGRYTLFLQAGDVLADDALYALADQVAMRGPLDVIYGDEDLVDAAGERRPGAFKPGWSPLYLTGAPWLGRAVAYAADLGDSAADALAALKARSEVRTAQVRRVLLHRPSGDLEALRREIAGAPAPTAVSSPAVRLVLIDGAAGTKGLPAVAVDRAMLGGWASPPSWLETIGDDEVLVFIEREAAAPAPEDLHRLAAALTLPGVGVAGPALAWKDELWCGLTGGCGDPEPIRLGRDALAPAVVHEVLGVGLQGLATRKRDFVAAGGFTPSIGGLLQGLDYCLRSADRDQVTVVEPAARLALTRTPRPPAPEAVSWHQQTWPEACAQDPFYREDALATHPATHAPAFLVRIP
ncbi:hypothetical protein [Caulobacter endophyticus]|uniref:hypothetical protein n=1 Tax=Caulobacter endophyticus TaxID=2172652 RepID=UPI00240EB6B3|nr:hypothetical protein [Caulobacter endophyticus]MDG2528807.1 hypothetical protein [Caulobacter endophyticus]